MSAFRHLQSNRTPPVSPEVDEYIREVVRQETKRTHRGMLDKFHQAFKMLADWCDTERRG